MVLIDAAGSAACLTLQCTLSWITWQELGHGNMVSQAIEAHAI